MEQLTKRKLYSSFSWSFLDQFLSFGINFVVQIIVARILDPSAYGIIAIVLIFVNLANALALSGFSSALIQKKEISNQDYDSAFWVSEGFSLALYVLIFLFAPFISDFYEINELTVYLRVFAIMLFLNSFNAVQRAYLQRSFNFKGTFFASLVSGIVSGIIGITLALLQFGVWAIIAQTLSSAFIMCITFMVFVPWKPTLSFHIRRAVDLFSYGWKLALTGLINSVTDSLIDTAIGKSVSVADLGFYTQGKRYPVTAATLVQNPLSNVLFPAFAVIQEKPNEIRNLMKQGLQIGSFFVVPLMLLLSLASDPLISLLLTEKWLPSVPVMQAICLMYSCLLSETINLRVYGALGRSDIYLYLHIGRAVVSIAVSVFVVVVFHNIYILAVCFSVTQAFYILLIETYPAGKLCDYPSLKQLADIAPIYLFATIAFISSAPLLLLECGALAKLLLLCSVFTGIYLLLSSLFKLPGLTFVKAEIASFVKNASSKINHHN